ncbi:hypothetical protein C5L38_27610 [Streptomyces sp. WAC00288]|nr:hypothetical protein C5L38_27610 [Streptomyces sp. WAC00288]
MRCHADTSEGPVPLLSLVRPAGTGLRAGAARSPFCGQGHAGTGGRGGEARTGRTGGDGSAGGEGRARRGVRAVIPSGACSTP